MPRIDSTQASRVTNAQETTDQLSAMSKKYLSPESLEPSKAPAKASPTASAEPNETSNPQIPLTAPQLTSNARKVTFAAEPEVSTFTSLPAHAEETPKSDTAGAKKAREPIYHPTERILELDDHDQIIGSRPLELIAPLPEDDPALHQGTIMGSLGPIVAEMNLMGPVLDDDTDVDDDDNYGDDDSSLDENDIGMTNIGRLITDDYRAEMEALMKKHEAALKSVGSISQEDPRSNAGLSPLAAPLDDPALAIPQERPDTADGSDGPSYAEEKELKAFNHRTRKGVRFSNDVDVSPAPSPVPSVKQKPVTAKPTETQNIPFSEVVMERVTHPVEPLVKPSTSKPSRFKAGLKAAKSGGPVLPLASSAHPTVVEPATTLSAFVEEDQPKKVSRFKAARLGGT
jgi:unconventional prefoldin RPB5 interactor 1